MYCNIDNIEVDEEEPKKPLKYQGTTMQPRSPGYYPTNASCCICEEEFPTIKEFEEHIQQHGEDTDFEYLKTMKHMYVCFYIILHYVYLIIVVIIILYFLGPIQYVNYIIDCAKIPIIFVSKSKRLRTT